jgi:nickel-dependent lactate racemase
MLGSNIPVNYLYDNEVKSISLPSGSKIIDPNNVKKRDAKEIIDRALKTPLKSDGLEKFLNDNKKILLIVNDGTRPTPTAQVLEGIENLLKNNEVTIIVATGCHRGANDAELHSILGKTYDTFKDNVVSHDAKDQSRLQYLGTSRNGTKLEINKAAIENDGILIIGSVEPHYFAGYTGGRKAIMPGIASYKSIEMNHHLALSEDARALELEKNPVHQDMVDTLSLLKDSHIFSIQCVMDSDHNIYEVQCGDIIESFDSAIEAADEVFTVNVEKKYDVVISVAKHPMDIDLYQSQKAMDNSKGILKENGILILVAACHEGKGPETFYNLIASSASPVNAINRINHSYKLGYHKAAKMAEMMRHFSVYAVSELSESVLKNIFMSKFDTLEDALSEALRIKGEDSDVAIIRDGCVTVPVVRK